MPWVQPKRPQRPSARGHAAVEERLALVCEQGAEADDRRLVDVGRRVVADEAVAAVARRRRSRPRSSCVSSRWRVTLKASTCGGAAWSGSSARGDAVRQREPAVARARAGKTGAGGPWARLNTLSKLFGGFSSWNDEHGQVLGHGVAEGGAEHADVVAAAVARAEHRLGVDLVGGAQARRPVDLVLDVAGEVDVADAADPDLSRCRCRASRRCRPRSRSAG